MKLVMLKICQRCKKPCKVYSLPSARGDCPRFESKKMVSKSGKNFKKVDGRSLVGV